jgi:hypothetical protein
MAPTGLAGEIGRLEPELDRDPQHVKISEVHHLAVEISAPVAIDHDREEQAGDQEEIRHPEWPCEGHQKMHEAGLPGGRLDPQH